MDRRNGGVIYHRRSAPPQAWLWAKGGPLRMTVSEHGMFSDSAPTLLRRPEMQAHASHWHAQSKRSQSLLAGTPSALDR
jgi:hypothetical protein